MMNAFGFLLGYLAATLLLAVLVVAGLLAAAAVLPRGHAVADQLREFASRVPGLAVRSVLLLDGLLFVAGVVLLTVLTFVHS